MAKIRPVRPPEPPKPKAPSKPEQWKGHPIETDVETVPLTVNKKHSVQYIGSQYFCVCGHDYPRPPMNIILQGSPAIEKWLNPLIEEHEKASQ